MTITDTQRATAVARGKYLGLLNAPYVFGGTSAAGIDCSGLTMEAWRAANVALPHNAAQQAQLLLSRKQLVGPSSANRSKLRPGDIIFYQGPGGTEPDTLGHCALFVEMFQGLTVIAQATQPGAGTELIRGQKYANVLFFGYMR
jgi:cell wall-associated NlpC family hydrolase